jgi:demethylmenaquinone methyltransferase/2-methoxy-6-polyprenyl-1,4-benzoquinol methylase
MLLRAIIPVGPEEHARGRLPGTRPTGAVDDASAARQVREMFSRIAPHYDLLNHLLSLRFDVSWRNRVARRFAKVLRQPEVQALDLCCGTGDLTLALEAQSREHFLQGGFSQGEISQGGASDERNSQVPSRGYQGRTAAAGSPAQRARFLGADFAHPMLLRAREKAGHQHSHGAHSTIEFLEADALRLPFTDESFDLVTTAFGFRNLANYGDGLAEVRRILRPGGSVAILEFAEPEGVLFGGLFRFYFRRVLPKIGGIISSNSQAYGYLPNSVARFPPPAELAELMQRAGFKDVAFERWTGGIVALHTARR